MRAHGNSVGPTHRPLVTGLLSGLIAAVPSMAMRAWSGALGREAEALGADLWLTAGGHVLIFALSALAYAFVFQRAANDMRSGWLLGISFGFLLWVIGPVSIWNRATGDPIATGTAAIGMFASYLAFGLTLGAAYPIVNRRTQSKLN